MKAILLLLSFVMGASAVTAQSVYRKFDEVEILSEESNEDLPELIRLVSYGESERELLALGVSNYPHPTVETAAYDYSRNAWDELVTTETLLRYIEFISQNLLDDEFYRNSSSISK